MIQFLRVRNLAIVEELSIEPGPGFNVLTGETGAGKSLLIDSLELLSGARGSSDMIRTGADRLQAEAILEIAGELVPLLDAAGVPDLESGELVIRREVAAGGRGRVTINGSVFGVRELSSVMDSLLEIHGQDAGRERIAGQTVREILDSFAQVEELRARASVLYDEWKQSAADLERLQKAANERDQRIDLLRYQVEELSGARLTRGEEDELRSERAMLANAQGLTSATAAAWTILDEDETAVTSGLSRAISLLQNAGRDVEELRALVDQLEQGRLLIVEASRDLERFASSIRHDPERLDQVEERLALLERLQRKYGCGSAAELLSFHEQLISELEELEDADQRTGKAAAEEARRFSRWKEIADGLSTLRRTAAPELSAQIQRELADLAMPSTTIRFEVSVVPQPQSRLELDGTSVAFGPEGYDRVEILIAANRGEEPRPMARIASGGELSRIQLAIATATFRRRKDRGGATLVFDEIDAGVGGRVAEAVGRKLQELARHNQVICVTHLPQIAALSDTHFRVWKMDEESRTIAQVERLDSEEERITEVARMLGGEHVTDSALEHARQLRAGSLPAPASANNHRR